jgi:Family of unknown function (DUF6790)
LRRGPRPITYRFVIDRLLRYVLIFPLGVESLWTFFCHIFIPEQAVAAIGWQTSPFQLKSVSPISVLALQDLVLLLISPRSKPASAKIDEASPAAARDGDVTAAAPGPRIEDELEKARQSLRESLKTGPEPEILPPLERKPLRMSSPLREGAADASDA